MLVWVETWEAAVLITNSILALLLNGMVVLLVYKFRSLRSSFNATIVNASISDIIVSLNILASTVETLTKNGKSASNAVWCNVTGFVNLLSFVASVMSLTAVSVNRFTLICKNHIYPEIFTKTGTTIYIFMVWIISALLSTPPFYGWARFSYHYGKSVCFVEWQSSKSYMFFMIGICFCGPISATMFSLVSILRVKRITAATLAKEDDFGLSTTAQSIALSKAKKNEKEERQITFSLVLIVVVFFVAWGPFVIVMFMDVFSETKVPRWLDMGSFLFGCFNSTANPIVYITLNTNFRKAIIKLLPFNMTQVHDTTRVIPSTTLN